MKIKYSDCRGQSLFEVVVALAISAIIIVSLVALVSSAIRNATFSKNKTLAARYAQEATEWLRGQRDSDPALFFERAASGTYCMASLSWDGGCGESDKISDTSFERKITFEEPPDSTVEKKVLQADIVVTWSDSQGDHEVRSVTDFTDWRQR